MPRDHLYYSCDSHFVEAPEVFAGLEADFGERAPLIVQDPPGKEGIYVMFPQSPVAVPVGRFGIAGARLDLPETQERIKHGWEQINPGVRDPVARLDEQRQDGIVGEVMYPSINMLAFSHPDREMVQAVFQRHNDWVADYQSHAPERLIGAACLPLPDVPESIAELQRGLTKGLRAFAIPCTAPPSLPYSDPHYEPFWSAAEEAGVPLTLHIFCGAEWGMSLPAYWNQVSAYALALAGVAWSAETLITGGVFARHPEAEGGLRGVGDGLGRALAAAARPRGVPHAQGVLAGHDGGAVALFPPQLLRHVRRRRDRRAHARPDRRRSDDVGQRLPPPRLDLAEQHADPRSDHGGRRRR